VTSGSDLALFAAGEAFEAYAQVANDKDFPVRVFYSPIVEEMRKLLGDDALMARLGELKNQGTKRFAMGPLKWIADGSIQGFTGKLKWPGYCGGEDHGVLLLSEDEVVEKLSPFHEAGFQLAIHTNGDAATESVLRALERILERHPRFDHRHRLEHCQMASRAMLRRMASLGVLANFFSNHVYYWGDVHRTQTMGLDKARRMDAAASALREGVTISIHSDHPVTPVNPLFTMWCAVNRRTRSGFELGSAEKLTALEALTAVTLGSAYLLGRDEELGSLEVGKFADFTVLSDSPLSVDPMTIKDIGVIATVVDGVVR
jgi:predicted amidohydrolase YtcJ